MRRVLMAAAVTAVALAGLAGLGQLQKARATQVCVICGRAGAPAVEYWPDGTTLYACTADYRADRSGQDCNSILIDRQIEALRVERQERGR